MKGVCMKRMAKYLLVGSIIIFFVNMMSFLLGDSSEITVGVRFDAVGNMERNVRHALGFVHPNALHLWLVTLFSLIIYLFHEKMRLGHYLILSGLSIFVYSFNLSRTGLFASFILLFLCYFFSRKKIIFKFFLSLLPSTLAIIMVLVSANFIESNSSFLRILNNFTSNRIFFSNIFLNHYPPRLLGWNTAFSINGAIIDTGYIDLLIRHGILIFTGYLVITFLAINVMFKKQLHIEIAIFLTFQIYNLTEPLAINISLNYSLLFLAHLFFKEFEEKSILNSKFQSAGGEKNEIIYNTPGLQCRKYN